MKRMFFILCGVALLSVSAFKSANETPSQKSTSNLDTVSIALAGNAWQAGKSTSIYFRADAPGDVNLLLRVNSKTKGKLKVSAGGQSYTAIIKDAGLQDVAVGNLKLSKAGYVKVDVEGTEDLSISRGLVTHLILQGADVSKRVSYVRDNESNRFYWGKRGPSVHLSYKIPEGLASEITYFYSEINVPKGMDPVGSYYMANGFGEGYFGIQTNSLTERRVLFSIWSPFSTDNPDAIPDSLKIRLLKKGQGVRTGEFGNEGSGGQSYLIFPWKTGETHAFLTSAKPDPASRSTTYTSYFKPAGGQWMLIASFSRPNTVTGLKRFHSFLENFDPKMGDQTRRASYINQWVGDVKGNWKKVTQATFTGDDIASRGFRKDVAGGVHAEEFYLQNGGFFNDFTPLKSSFVKAAGQQKAPVIDFSKLP